MKTIEQKAKKVPAIRFAGFDDEWVEKKLGETASFSKGMGYSKGDLKENGTPIVLYGRLYTKYETIISDVDTFADAKSNSVYSKGGEVIVPGSGETAEDISIASVVKKSGVLLGGDLNVITPPKNLDSVFLAISISNGKPHSDMAKMAQGKSVVHLHNTDLAEINLPYPNIIEQQKIGSFFSNIDSLISLEQKKYDKLTQVKKSMLEKMFPKEGATVPEIRFAGFTGEWEKKKLGDMGRTYTGLSGKTKSDFGHGMGRFVTYMNVFLNPVSDPNRTEAVEIDNTQNTVQHGDVFFTTSSETPEEVGMSSVWLDKTENIYLNSFCFGYRPTENIDPFYLAYMLRSNVIRKKITYLAQGISRYNISKNGVMEIEVPLPNFKEQQKIGSYFSHLDSLISLQQRKLEKLKNIKKSLLEKMFV